MGKEEGEKKEANFTEKLVTDATPAKQRDREPVAHWEQFLGSLKRENGNDAQTGDAPFSGSNGAIKEIKSGDTLLPVRG